MRLVRSENIEAPPASVFRLLVDFDHWERAALRQGAEVQRTDSLPRPAPGVAWRLGFAFRGRPRLVTLQLTDLRPDEALVFSGQGSALDGTARIDLDEMGPKRTKITVTLEIGARTLAARLFLQSLRLAQGRITRRFDGHVSRLVAHLENRFRNNPRR